MFDKSTQNAVLVVDSKNRKLASDTSTKFYYSINQNITRIKTIKLASYSIPYTFYVINSATNTLSLNGGANLVTIPIGNYNVSSIASALQTSLAAAFSSDTVTVTFDISTLLFTITKTSAFTVDSKTDVATSTLAPFIGYTVTSASGTSATANAVYTISGPNYLVIMSNYLSKGLQNKTSHSDDWYKNAFAIVPVNASPGGIITQSIDVRSTYSSTINILSTDVIDFTIYDDSGNLLNLNGAEINMVFVMDIY
jgi:hypothetical protein